MNRPLTKAEIDHIESTVALVEELGGDAVPTRDVWELWYSNPSYGTKATSEYSRGYQTPTVIKALKKCEQHGYLKSTWAGGYYWSTVNLI